MDRKKYIKISYVEVAWIFSILSRYYFTDKSIREILRLLNHRQKKAEINEEGFVEKNEKKHHIYDNV